MDTIEQKLNTPREFVLWLTQRRNKVCGETNNIHGCFIANFLNNHIGPGFRATVSRSNIRFFRGSKSLYEVDTPAWVHDFIGAVDLPAGSNQFPSIPGKVGKDMTGAEVLQVLSGLYPEHVSPALSERTIKKMNENPAYV